MPPETKRRWAPRFLPGLGFRWGRWWTRRQETRLAGLGGSAPKPPRRPKPEVAQCRRLPEPVSFDSPVWIPERGAPPENPWGIRPAKGNLPAQYFLPEGRGRNLPPPACCPSRSWGRSNCRPPGELGSVYSSCIDLFSSSLGRGRTGAWGIFLSV